MATWFCAIKKRQREFGETLFHQRDRAGRNKGARLFCETNRCDRPLNDRERRFLPRDLLPFSLSARHDFSFSLFFSLSLSFFTPYLSLLYSCYSFHQHEARRHDASIRGRTGSFFFFIKAIQAVGGVATVNQGRRRREREGDGTCFF